MELRHTRESEPGEPNHIHVPRPSRLGRLSAATPVVMDARQLCGELVVLTCGESRSDSPHLS
jgi:hypothetical protein